MGFEQNGYTVNEGNETVTACVVVSETIEVDVLADVSATSNSTEGKNLLTVSLWHSTINSAILINCRRRFLAGDSTHSVYSKGFIASMCYCTNRRRPHC